MKRHLRQAALRTTLIYILFAVLWITLSDSLLEMALTDVATMVYISTIKGWIFVAVTGAMLYALIAKALAAQEAQNERLQESERFLSLATEGAGVGVWSWDIGEKAGLVNDGFAHMLGYELEELGRIDRQRWLNLVHPDDYAASLAVRRAHLAGESPFFESEVRLRHKDGHWVWVQTRGKVTQRDRHGRPLTMSGTHVDITERYRVARILQRKSAIHAVLSGTNKAIVQTSDRQELFDAVCRAALELAGFRLVWIGELQNDPEQTLKPVAVAGPAIEFMQHLNMQCAPGVPTYNGPSAVAVREQRSVVVNDFSTYQGLVATDVLIPVYGLRCGMAMPVTGGGFRGCMTVYAEEVGYFDAEVSALLEEVANDISFALANIAAAEQRARDELQLRLHARVFEESGDGMMITDSGNRIVMVNRAFCTMTGYTQEEVKGRNPGFLSSGRHERQFFLQMWATLLSAGYWKGEIWNRRRDGQILRSWLTINRVLDAEGRTAHHVAVYGDLSEQRAQEQLEWLRRFDSLTGLPNRLLLEDRVNEAITHARQYNRHVALMSVNLDRFRYVNESLGHVTGDDVLRRIGARFTESVGETATVSRLSGDNFAVLVPDLNDTNEVIRVAETLLKAATAVQLEGSETELTLTASLGIALFPSDGADFHALLQKSEAALVRVREEGSNGYAFYTQDINNRARSMLSMTNTLKQALDNDWFVLHYQPQIGARSGKVEGVEALLRLQHPSEGLVSPAQFVPIAEETGMIVEIGARVIREACRQLREWLDAGHPELTMAVNLSAKQLRDKQLVAVVRDALHDFGIPPSLLELEFTESMAMRNLDASLALMQQLKALGVRLAIDDFGTGYSSLNYLRQFPVDRVKIDQSFVASMLDERRDEAIVQTVVVLARALGMHTVAEGVESGAQVDCLRRLGCDVLQGYFFSRPLPAESVIRQFGQLHGKQVPV